MSKIQKKYIFIQCSYSVMENSIFKLYFLRLDFANKLIRLVVLKSFKTLVVRALSDLNLSAVASS